MYIIIYIIYTHIHLCIYVYIQLYTKGNELHSKFTLDIHIVTNSFTLLLRSDLQTIQHITVKDILDDNIFYIVTFNKRVGISNFD